MIIVAEWVDLSDVPDNDELVWGWTGGWFNFKTYGLRWNDYLSHFQPEVHPYLEAIREEVVKNNYKFTGEEHQNNSGVPKFSNGKYLCLSWRAWGDLMAAIWSEEEDKDYNYMDFYM